MAIAEWYVNRLYAPEPTHLVPRWWVTPHILVGGSVVDEADWRHLQKDFGIAGVLNVETEHSDEGKGIDELCECRVPDTGAPFAPELVQQAVWFALRVMSRGPIYVHCQMGGSRSPAFAYAILRGVDSRSPEDALSLIRSGRDWKATYGEHPYHQAYLSSIEAALASACGRVAS